MLEWGDVLRTWALERPPHAGKPIPADALADHRLRYLDYEGPVRGERGSVTRWDKGLYELLEDGVSELRVRLVGNILQGEFEVYKDLETGRGWFRRIEP